jgi:PBP1b-binding outer membrane lipoprotein LpoB
MIIGSIFIYAGCSSGSSNPTSSSSESSDSISAQATTGGNPANPAKPDRPADLQGKVKQIRGNQVSIFKAEATGPELTEEEKAKRREQIQQLSPEEKAKAREERSKITDETIDITIPVGIPIVSNQNVGGQVETETLNLADIQQGNFIKFWFANGNPDEIILVQVSKLAE